MWILVVGPTGRTSSEDGARAQLRQLGCRVETSDLWGGLGSDDWDRDPPTVVLLEAVDELGAARAALSWVRATPALADVPCLLATSVTGLGRLDPRDAFDDFVLFPYVPAELYIRIRRLEWRASEFSSEECIKMGDLSIDLAAHEVEIAGRAISLTQQEFALLAFLSENRGRVWSREQLLRRVWGVDHYAGSRTVDVHVRRLRKKLGHAVDGLETIRGLGYKMRAP